MITIIAGGREFNNYNLLKESLKDVPISEVVSGRARGADLLGEKWAKEGGVKIAYFPADWNTYGKRAGFLRNTEMAEYAEQLVAFWDGESKGTKHMIETATKRGLKIKVVLYGNRSV